MSRTPTPIPLPDLGAAPAVFGVWHVGVGEAVREGERLAEVLIPGAVVDLASPADGVLRTQAVQARDPLTPGQSLGTIDPA